LGSELESFVSAQGLLDIASTAGEEAAAAAHIDEGAVIVKQRARTLRHAAQRRAGRLAQQLQAEGPSAEGAELTRQHEAQLKRLATLLRQVKTAVEHGEQLCERAHATRQQASLERSQALLDALPDFSSDEEESKSVNTLYSPALSAIPGLDSTGAQRRDHTTPSLGATPQQCRTATVQTTLDKALPRQAERARQLDQALSDPQSRSAAAAAADGTQPVAEPAGASAPSADGTTPRFFFNVWVCNFFIEQ
jgi:hypothetical protein